MKASTIHSRVEQQHPVFIRPIIQRRTKAPRRPKAPVGTASVHPCGEFFAFRTLQNRLAKVRA